MSEQTHNSLITPSSKNSRLSYIDTLRGLAALWVFLLHTHQYWLNDVKPTGLNITRIVTFIIGSGGKGVDLFIVLSGFCLFYPLIRASPQLKKEFKVLEFYRRRAFRLLPAYYASLALISLIILPFIVTTHLTWPHFISHIFLVQTFFDKYIGAINGPYWSIALEAQLYLVFPLLLILYRRHNMIALVVLGITSALLWQKMYPYIHNTGMSFNPDYHFPARWIEFIAGMWAAKLVCHPTKNSRKMALLCFIFTLPFTMVLGTGISVRLELPQIIGHSFAALTFASLVIYLSGFAEKHFTGRKPLAAFTQLGVISYSFYLLHQPIILLLDPWIESLHLGIFPTFGLALVTSLPLTIFAGYIFFVCIERPFIELGKRTASSATLKQSVVSEQAVP